MCVQGKERSGCHEQRQDEDFSDRKHLIRLFAGEANGNCETKCSCHDPLRGTETDARTITVKAIGGNSEVDPNVSDSVSLEVVKMANRTGSNTWVMGE